MPVAAFSVAAFSLAAFSVAAFSVAAFSVAAFSVPWQPFPVTAMQLLEDCHVSIIDNDNLISRPASDPLTFREF
jgi:hypothetical protein